MKQYTTLKVGYTYSRMYGVTGEYFVTIVVNEKGIQSFAHHGMYGSEDRVNQVLEDKGYAPIYTSHDYGQMTKKDMLSLFKSEKEAIEYVKNNY